MGQLSFVSVGLATASDWAKYNSKKNALVEYFTWSLSEICFKILAVELFLVRHGIAEEPELAEAEGRGDSDRKLTSEGKEKTARIARFFAKRVEPVSLILHSPYRRAIETAELFRLEFPQAELVEAKYLRPHDSSEEAMGMLQDYGGFSSVMVVGHEPHLSGLLSLLLLGDRRLPVGFKKAGIAGLQWSPRGPAHLNFLLQPKFL